MILFSTWSNAGGKFTIRTPAATSMIISKTPFRVSFFGGGTDYPSWYREHGGRVIGTTIDKYCYLHCRLLPPFFTHKHRLSYSIIEVFSQIDEIKHPAVRETFRHFKIGDGISVSHDGDLPARSGMGSSSAFTVGLVNSLSALQGKRLSKSELTSCAIHIEQELIRENVGSQDQTFAAHGGFNKIFFEKDGSVKVEPVAADPETFRALEKRLMLFFTGISREASAIAVEQIQNIPKRKKELETTAGFVDEACKFLKKGPSGLNEFGALLHEAWQVKKSLSSRITTDVIDEAYALARKHGATGGKILGAGGGGFLLVFAEPERQAAIRQALGHWVHVPFSFENAGSEIIFSRL